MKLEVAIPSENSDAAPKPFGNEDACHKCKKEIDCGKQYWKEPSADKSDKTNNPKSEVYHNLKDCLEDLKSNNYQYEGCLIDGVRNGFGTLVSKLN